MSATIYYSPADFKVLWDDKKLSTGNVWLTAEKAIILHYTGQTNYESKHISGSYYTTGEWIYSPTHNFLFRTSLANAIIGKYQVWVYPLPGPASACTVVHQKSWWKGRHEPVLVTNPDKDSLSILYGGGIYSNNVLLLNTSEMSVNKGSLYLTDTFMRYGGQSYPYHDNLYIADFSSGFWAESLYRNSGRLKKFNKMKTFDGIDYYAMVDYGVLVRKVQNYAGTAYYTADSNGDPVLFKGLVSINAYRNNTHTNRMAINGPEIDVCGIEELVRDNGKYTAPVNTPNNVTYIPSRFMSGLSGSRKHAWGSDGGAFGVVTSDKFYYGNDPFYITGVFDIPFGHEAEDADIYFYNTHFRRPYIGDKYTHVPKLNVLMRLKLLTPLSCVQHVEMRIYEYQNSPETGIRFKSEFHIWYRHWDWTGEIVKTASLLATVEDINQAGGIENYWNSHNVFNGDTEVDDLGNIVCGLKPTPLPPLPPPGGYDPEDYWDNWYDIYDPLEPPLLNYFGECSYIDYVKDYLELDSPLFNLDAVGVELSEYNYQYIANSGDNLIYMVMSRPFQDFPAYHYSEYKIIAEAPVRLTSEHRLYMEYIGMNGRSYVLTNIVTGQTWLLHFPMNLSDDDSIGTMEKWKDITSIINGKFSFKEGDGLVVYHDRRKRGVCSIDFKTGIALKLNLRYKFDYYDDILDKFVYELVCDPIEHYCYDSDLYGTNFSNTNAWMAFYEEELTEANKIYMLAYGEGEENRSMVAVFNDKVKHISIPKGLLDFYYGYTYDEPLEITPFVVTKVIDVPFEIKGTFMLSTNYWDNELWEVYNTDRIEPASYNCKLVLLRDHYPGEGSNPGDNTYACDLVMFCASDNNPRQNGHSIYYIGVTWNIDNSVNYIANTEGLYGYLLAENEYRNNNIRYETYVDVGFDPPTSGLHIPIDTTPEGLRKFSVGDVITVEGSSDDENNGTFTVNDIYTDGNWYVLVVDNTEMVDDGNIHRVLISKEEGSVFSDPSIPALIPKANVVNPYLYEAEDGTTGTDYRDYLNLFGGGDGGGASPLPEEDPVTPNSYGFTPPPIRSINNGKKVTTAGKVYNFDYDI